MKNKLYSIPMFILLLCLLSNHLISSNPFSLKANPTLFINNRSNDYSELNPISDYTLITSLSEFESTINIATEHLQPTIRLEVECPTMALYTSILDTLDCITQYHITLSTSSIGNILEIKFDYTQLHKLTQTIAYPSLFSTLTIHDQLIFSMAQNILDEILTNNMSDYEKELAIHDYIINTTSYDYDNFLNDTIPSSCFTITGVLLFHTAVCQGYSETTKFLCNLAGIECEIVIGTADNIDHAWNVIKLDNEWYMLDTTFDDPIFFDKDNNRVEMLSHDYFNVTNEILSEDHTWDEANYPIAQNLDYHYYNMNEQLVTSYDDFKGYVAKQILNGNKDITCYIVDFDESIYDLNFVFDYYNSGSFTYSIPASSYGSCTLILE